MAMEKMNIGRQIRKHARAAFPAIPLAMFFYFTQAFRFGVSLY
ncbi:MAG: hypothetical protein ACD_75C02423G0018 [uncultured bacterium]|nr:MAG: hypothetical protein ACD_75C02423G0018 [uncultured bacterium]